MPDKKITVTDEMVQAAMDAAQTTGERSWESLSDSELIAELRCDVATWRDRAEKAERERDEVISAGESLLEMLSEAQGMIARGEVHSMTAREHLDATWETAYVPEDGIIPAGAAFIRRYVSFDDDSVSFSQGTADRRLPASMARSERRLLDPPAPKRPDGAEEIEGALRGELSNLIDENGRFHGSIDGVNGLADRLASRGVRVVSEDGAS